MAALLTACNGNALEGVSSSRQPTMKPVANSGWNQWVQGFRPRARAKGISDATFDRAFSGAGYLPEVIALDRTQIETRRTLEEYLLIAASDERVAKGRANYARYHDLLMRIEAAYGVDAHVIVAVWGLETMYGERRGNVPVVSGLSTLAYDGRRGSFFESQLIAALKIIQAGDTSPQHETGSWAGAMGHTQFIPTTYLAYAVDFNGDGRRDIWSDDPTDALASTANYLAKHGWRKGQPWGGIEGSTGAQAGTRKIEPHPGGPAFIIGPNFDVIKRYNNSTKYALGVGYLADRIAGAPSITDSFPPDRYGLTADQRKQLQSRLNVLGYDAGSVDGVFGNKTRTAITAYQQKNGLPVTGEPSMALLNSMN